MPSYKLVTIDTNIKGLPDGTPDADVLKSVANDTKLVTSNNKLYSDDMTRLQALAKQKLTILETLVTKMKGSKYTPDPKDTTFIQAAVVGIQTLVTEAITSGKDLMAAHAEYRGGWPDAARAKLQDKAKIEGFVAYRQKTIDDQKAPFAVKVRIEEYHKRAETLRQAAELQLKKTAGESSTDLIKDLCKRLEGDVATLQVEMNKAEQKTKSLAAYTAKATITAKDYKFAEGLAIHTEAARKGMSGMMKTVKQEAELLKKTVGSRNTIFKTELDSAKMALALESNVVKIASGVEKEMKKMPALKEKIKG